MPGPKKQTVAAATIPGGLFVPDLFGLREVGKLSDDFRPQLQPGAHAIDLVVWLQGTLNVGHPQTATVPKKPAAELVLARVFDVVGAGTAQKIADQLRSAFYCEPSELSAALSKLVLEHLTERKEQARAGNVSGSFQLLKLDQRPPAAQNSQARQVG